MPPEPLTTATLLFGVAQPDAGTDPPPDTWPPR
jgi:hypothetical protein